MLQKTAMPYLLLGFAFLVQTVPALSIAAHQHTDDHTREKDQVLMRMHDAFHAKQQKQLTRLLPQAQGHILEPWAAYWELKNRLEKATDSEVQAFLQRYAGTYQEDRLRNDWLLLLGERGEWSSFLRLLAGFRMQDDLDVRCYAVSARRAPAQQAKQVLQSWLALGKASDSCSQAAAQLFVKNALSASDLWPLARWGAEHRRVKLVQQVLKIIAPQHAGNVARMLRNPKQYLNRLRKAKASEQTRQLAVLALTRLAVVSWQGAAKLMRSYWVDVLSESQCAWVWAQVGKAATLDLDRRAYEYYALATNAYLSDNLLQWKVRAALRAGHWQAVLSAILAMSNKVQEQPVWQYWGARALQALGKKSVANQLFIQLTTKSTTLDGFYEQLAIEALGKTVKVPPPPAPLLKQEMDAMRANRGLQRALYAFDLGLRSIATREWNYETNLHIPGGMNDRQRLAAAELACAHEVWDRCINTSARSKHVFHAQQRYPMPFLEDVTHHSLAAGLMPTDVYGLIRQESRFIDKIRSSAGASGLMQVMKSTARVVARKIGLKGYKHKNITDVAVNLRLGTSYLKMVLDDFEGSKPLALAAYNAGPNRPRRWRKGPTLEPAIWIESIPFAETRGYVKKVLSGAVLYTALLNNQPASLQQQLGNPIGPRSASAPAPNTSLP